MRSNKQSHLKYLIRLWTLRIIQGALIGSSAILPGVSGGVLCVVFGIYQPMIALLSHPVQSLIRYYRLFIPIAIGWVIGFLGLARVVEVLFDASSALAASLFVGLIAGMFPSLFREVEKKGTGAVSWSYFVVSLVIFYAFLSSLKAGQTIKIAPTTAWYFLCGAIWGLSLVIPGLSSSSILVFLGLYQPMAAGIADMRLDVILPLFVGIVLSAVGLARFVNFLLKRYHVFIHHVILGIVVASTLLIIPSGFSSTVQMMLSVAFFLVGYTVSLWMEKLSAVAGKQADGMSLDYDTKRAKLRRADH
ncbi:putative membrane protein [Caldicoprobacter guelmensis]|uniref:DUF368 domain-containing protein n=1 Tax=Caldicoprobacter guelmensis TaxID=1170224 RepID=UPI001956482B|nr:DUF368 domain-containing protein [Caldicoprobacter guelmensis]MBM7582566.1 putative membrane protein [Caldicoprobacter guelmensis]